MYGREKQEKVECGDGGGGRRRMRSVMGERRDGRGTDLTSQICKSVRGAFLGFGRAKNVGKIWGDRKRGGERLFGANEPQNPHRVFLLRAARYARVLYLLV